MFLLGRQSCNNNDNHHKGEDHSNEEDPFGVKFMPPQEAGKVEASIGNINLPVREWKSEDNDRYTWKRSISHKPTTTMTCNVARFQEPLLIDMI